MTVLKFRAWVVNESNRFMAYPHDTQLNSAISNALQHQLGYENADPKRNNIEQWQKDIVFMQFTGITDVQGKDVYEGDILNIGADQFGFVTVQSGLNAQYVVLKQGCDYVLKRSDLPFVSGRLSRVSEIGWICKVVGNIYENQK